MKTGIDLIAAERARQISVEGWTPSHDDQHQLGEMNMAARAYALHADTFPSGAGHDCAPPDCWPWERHWWKPSPDGVRNLVKAGALIAAEIDRLQRLANPPTINTRVPDCMDSGPLAER